MNNELTPFDHRPDPALGAALRAALEPGDQAAFVTRVMAGLDAARAPSWEILAAWARRGLAAAAVAALVAGFLLGRSLHAPASLDDAFAASGTDPAAPALAALATSQRAPDASVVLASMIER